MGLSMHALTFEDLLPLEEFAGRRRDLFEAQCRYLDRYRRVRVGPGASLLFENRQTLWFRVQEVLRIARLTDRPRVQQELDLYNRLLPGSNRLHAALLVDVHEERLAEELAPWHALRGEDVALVLGSRICAAELVTCRPEDRCIGAAHWIHFDLDAAARALLAEYRVPVHVALNLQGRTHASSPLGEEIRQSLLDDLALSDRAR
jgi:hypothetical protein